MSLIKSFFTLILAAAIAGFAILNRANIAVTWSPVHEPYTLPIYALTLAALAFGFLLGGLSVWANHASIRTTRRRQKKQIKTLEKELAQTTEKASANAAPPSDFFPALPKRKQT